jgi:hypothetical protein
MTKAALREKIALAGIAGAIISGSGQAIAVTLPDDDAMARFTFDVAHWCGQRIEAGSWIMRPFFRIADERA